MRIVILGGGLSGLTCGLALAKSGHEVTILEKEVEIGGLARSYRQGPFSFDYGPHFLFSPKVVEVLSELLERDFFSELLSLKGFKGKMYFDRKYFNFPFEPKDLFMNARKTKLPSMTMDFLKTQISAALGDDCPSVDLWIKKRVGSALYDYTNLGNYIEKLYGEPAEKISRDWGIQKLKFLNNMTLGGVGKRVLFSGDGKQGGVYYPSTGIDYISHCLGEAALHRGATIELESEVTEIIDREKTKEVVFSRKGETRTLSADFLISTMPIRKLVEMLKPVPSDLVETARGLHSRTLCTLFLMVDRVSVTKHGCVYFSEKKFPFKRMTEFRNLSPGMAPDGKTGLCIETTRSEGFSLEDETAGKTLCDQVVAALAQEGFIRESDVIDYTVKTVPFAYPIYELSYLGNLVSVLEHLAGVKNLVTLGRNGLFTYNTMANSIRSAFMLSQRISGDDSRARDGIASDFYNGRVEKYTNVPFGQTYRPNTMFLE